MKYHDRKKKQRVEELENTYNNYHSISELITDHLLTKNGSVASNKINNTIFKRSKANKEIHDLTSFLPESSPMKQRIYCILHNITSNPTCIVCGDLSVFLPNKDKGYSKTCGKQSCKTRESSHRRIETLEEKYGMKQSPLTLRRVKERVVSFHEKGKETLFKNHGVHNPGQIPTHSNAVKDTLLQRYGVTHPSKIPRVQAANKDRMITNLQALTDNAIVIDVTEPPSLKKENYASPCPIIVFKCKNCDREHNANYETFKWRSRNLDYICETCSGVNKGSAAQHSLYNSIKQFDPEAVSNDKSLIPPYEIDISSARYKIGIEYDGVFWHSYNSVESTAERRYHLNKTIQLEEIGYKLIHVFESEWMYKRDIVLSRLCGLFNRNQRIYARKCKVQSIDSKAASPLIDKWHIQGTAAASVYLGLIFEGNIVSIMSFGKSRFDKKAEWELIRFCSKLDTNIVGGASRLFTAFVNQYNPKSVVSYADRRWSNGNLYEVLGFKFQKNTQPNYFYYHHSSNDVKLHSRIHFQKHKLKDKLPLFDPNLTEAENVFNNGYRRIWDCGNKKYLWTPS